MAGPTLVYISLVSMAAYSTVLKAWLGTMFLPVSPYTVMQPDDMHMHITDHITNTNMKFCMWTFWLGVGCYLNSTFYNG